MDKHIFKSIWASFIVLMLSHYGYGQKANNYEKEWKAINKLEYDGLTKSALKSTEQLYATIKADKDNPAQTAQHIKALLFLNKYQARLEEDGLVKAIYRFEQEAAKATLPVKPILQSMVAELYDRYLQQNLYKFRDRTTTQDFDQKDIRTWDISKITDKIYELYLGSMQSEETKNIAIDDFSAIVHHGRNVKGLRPTLYDFLLHRALDFFVSGRHYLTKPAYKFYLESEQDFADAKTFATQKLEAKDKLSSSFQALLLFQEGLKFHLDDKNPIALIDLELKRLKFAKDKSILPNKNTLYLKRLEALAEQFKAIEASSEIMHKIALFYYEQGQQYKPSPTDLYRWDIKKAYKICNEAIKAFPNSYGSSYCKSLKLTIETKKLRVNIEEVNSIDQASLSLLSYKNVDAVYFKAIPVTKAQYNVFNSKYGEAKTKYLNSLSGAYKWNVKLQNEGDFQQHSTEFATPPLKNGFYLLVASANEKFTYNNNGLAFTSFYVSNFAMADRSVEGQSEFYVTDRNTGAPLADVKAEFFVSKYNSLLRKYESVKIHTTTTDKDGFMKSKPYANQGTYYRNSFSIKLSKAGEILHLENNYSNYRQYEPEKEQRTSFFLDRAIYRPGQIVYFKGLVLDQMSDGKAPTLVANQERVIEFFDANAQSIAKVTVISNEYGTFHGSFTAPSSGMLGQMFIQDNYNRSSKYFRVEEYKRPKFEVKALPVKESFKIDDMVTVTGQAKAYAGSTIDGAKVQYRVYRQARFPYWNWRWWGWYIPFNQERQEITFGETETDTEGKYSIEFQAIPDKSIPKDKNPEFSYTVEATVTDITGETHTSTSNVRVGYIALDIQLSVPDNINKTDAKPIKISSKNLNYEYEAAKGNIVVEQLTTPKTIYKTRYWQKPDYYLLKEEDFKKKFPHYAYKNEDEASTWKTNKQVLKTTFDTEKSKELIFGKIKNWKQGRYKITLTTKDKYGSPIELVKFFTIYDAKGKDTPLNTALFLANNSYYDTEPSTTIKVDFGSFNKNAYVLYEIEHDNKIVHKEWINPKGRKQASIKVEEKHRGNLHFHLTTVLNGAFYNQSGTIYVPWTNKELNIEYATFRDKLYPGQKEKWQIKISGHKGDQVSAELLAGMYDASLDAFAANSWYFNVHRSSYSSLQLRANNYFTSQGSQLLQYNWNPRSYPESRGYKTFNWNGFSFYEYDYYDGGMVEIATTSRSGGKRRSKGRAANSLRFKAQDMDAPAPAPMMEQSREEMEEEMDVDEMIVADSEMTELTDTKEEKDDSIDGKPSGGEEDFGDVKVRTNLNETVFFYPDLKTDKDGNVIIEFTMNEALTKWKFMTMAHTKDLQTAIDTREVVTQKDLMVMPNAPRFFRENDQLTFTAKVSNLTEETMNGQAQLQLFDAISMEPIDIAFGNNQATVDFEAKGGQSAPLAWKLSIPDGWTTAVVHRVVAKAGNFSDGEESALPVLTNRMLVTETQPLPIRGNSSKDFVFKRMAETSKSTTLKHHKLTLEFTQNPAWYAIQSLPYLMEYPYECTEQIFSRYYANSLASDVANSHPKVKRVFDQWENIDTEALKSNLSKNQELKYALLEETPWVLQAQNEAIQKQNVGLLFDLNRMGNELAKARDKMADRQLANGGFSWMPGGRDSWYISQYIVEGMGHLKQLGVKDLNDDPKMREMIRKAVSYIDDELAIYYKELLKYAKRSGNAEKYLAEDHLNQMVIHYFYARSFFLDQKITNKTTETAIKYYEGQAIKYWRTKSMYMQGLLALGLHRKGVDKETPMKIVNAARENALNSEELGMYWKYPSGYYWYQLPIETHALMIELFDVVAKDAKAVEDLKVWLLKAKQTTHWKTTKATAAACYSLLMSGDNWLLDDKEIDITIGGQKLDQSKIKKEAGTGYFKTTWEGNEITNEMANISVKNPNNVVAWGAMYWQYFENLDKITHFKETPLKLNKQLFKQVNTDKGPVLKPITNETLEPGDLVKVRIEIKVDRSMEYVHMKDMRASGFEPVNVLSQYKYQGGLGYYESTRDASTNFFFSYLSKGTYVFEYPLRVNHKGDFSNGITTIQCMYAPEFTAHSEGVRVVVE